MHGLNGDWLISRQRFFGCTVPASCVQSVRGSEDRYRIMLITPFMSCSARLPIYLLFSELFFPDHAMLVSYCMYLIGIAVAIASAFLLHKMDRKKNEDLLLIELPEYKLPSARTVCIYVWEKVKDYLTKAGTTIFVASIIIWFLGYYPNHDAYETVAEQQGKFLYRSVGARNRAGNKAIGI